MCVDTNSKKVTKIISDIDRKGMWSVLDVSHDIIVAQFSTPNSPPQLVSFIYFSSSQHATSPSLTMISTKFHANTS